MPELRAHAVEIDSLTPDPANPNSHDARSVAVIAASLAEFGQRKPLIVVRKTRIITSGNGTHAAAKKLGWTHIAAFLVDDDAVQSARWAIADNRTAEFSEWDVDHLNSLREGLDSEGRWKDLNELMAIDDLLPPPAADTPAAPAEPIPERYQLVVTVADQSTQEQLFRTLSTQGYKVRVLTT